jgi:hypothetical protein
MIIKIEKDPQGSFLKNIPHSLKRIPTTPVGKAIVLTGSNGTGKTALINSFARAAGLGIRFSSSHSKYDDPSCTALDMNEAQSTCGGASLYKDDNSGPLTFDAVFRYRGDETRMMPIAMDTEEDFTNLFGMRASHGQVNLAKLGKLLKDARADLKKGSKLLLLFDEPETGFSIDIVALVAKRFRELCEELITPHSLLFNSNVVISTQSPFILKSCELGGATRIDLGGWMTDNKDPFKELDDAVLEFINKPFPKSLKDTGGSR